MAKSQENLRNRELAMIHIAKVQLGMDDETYRSMLFTVARVNSAKELDFKGRKDVLDHLKSRGFNSTPARGAKSNRPLASDPVSKKIRKLWILLAQAGAINDSSEKALNSFVKKHTGIDSLDWLDSHQAHQVIEVLKKWLSRYE